MTQYAYIKDGAIVERREFDDVPPDMSRKGFVWLPIERIVDPLLAGKVYENSDTVAILNDKVVLHREIRDKTDLESSTEKDAAIAVIPLSVLTEMFQLYNEIQLLKGGKVATMSEYVIRLQARI